LLAELPDVYRAEPGAATVDLIRPPRHIHPTTPPTTRQRPGPQTLTRFALQPFDRCRAMSVFSRRTGATSSNTNRS
jgi:hypothetical protein